MTESDFTQEPLDERQADPLRTVSRMLDEPVDIAERDLPDTDPTVHEDELQDITETKILISETWAEIKEWVETHLGRIALDESLGQDSFDALAISGHPPADQALTLSVRYDRQGTLRVDIDNP